MQTETEQFTVLVADDERGTRQLLSDILTDQGYQVVMASNGLEAIHRVSDSRPDLILLDWQMPGMNGIEVCRRLRTSGNDVPILFVTARSQEVDEIVATMSGADHYITKPFTRARLLMRVLAALRRRSQIAPPSRPIRWADLEVDEERCEAQIGGRALRLSRAEFQILTSLVRAQGRVVRRSGLLEEIWDMASRSVCSRTIDLHISHIRAALGEQRTLIETVRGVGYRLRS